MLGLSKTARLCCVLAICMQTYALDSFEARHKQLAAGNPTGLHFTISLDGAKYHIGQSIRLQYKFSSDSGQYRIGARAFDKADRSLLERFEVDRPGDVSDPLNGFWDLFGVLYCSDVSSRSSPNWSLDPGQERSDTIEITQYFRFLTPGTYRLYAITQQIVPDSAAPNNQPRIASENLVTFEILPRNSQSDNKEVQDIIMRTEQDDATAISPQNASRLLAIGTPEAQRAALQLHFRPGHHPSTIALSAALASADRKKTIALLQARISEVSLPLDGDLLLSLALLQLLDQQPALTADNIRNAGRAHADALRNMLLQFVFKDFEAAMQTLDRRSEVSRALTVKYLSQLAGGGACSLPFVFPETDRRKLQALRLSGLPDLPAYDRLDELMNFGWAKDTPPEQLLPVMRAVYDSTNRKYSLWSPQIRRYALDRIAELDPEQARKLVLLDLDSVGGLDLHALERLHLRPGPDLDAALIGILEERRTEEMDRAAPLVGLYATAGVLDRVKRIYEIHAGGWPCPIESGLLTYFVRVAPAYGTATLGSALAEYPASGMQCSERSLLTQVAILRNAPELTPFKIALLNDPHPEKAREGARALSIGDANAIPVDAIVERLRLLHEQWHDFDSHKNDLDYLGRWNSGYSQLETELVSPLMNLRNSPEHMDAWTRALEFCVTDGCRDRLQRRMQRGYVSGR